MLKSINSIAVAYLLRGKNNEWIDNSKRFFSSYTQFFPGVRHTPYLIIKGFSSYKDKNDAINLGRKYNFEIFECSDQTFDIGAYSIWSRSVREDVLFCMNSSSEIVSENWLLKLIKNFDINDFDLLSCSGSYESLIGLSKLFPPFPNVHVRSNAFMINRQLLNILTEQVILNCKLDTYLFESGRNGLTAKIIKMGGKVGVVGKNGRAFNPDFWPFSGVFRQMDQANLMIEDNATRDYRLASWDKKQKLCKAAWGRYIEEKFDKLY